MFIIVAQISLMENKIEFKINVMKTSYHTFYVEKYAIMNAANAGKNL